MKTRKNLTHNLLLAELYNQVKFPIKVSTGHNLSCIWLHIYLPPSTKPVSDAALATHVIKKELDLARALSLFAIWDI